MAVVAIIGILLGIVTAAASNSIKLARKQKAKAICACALQGIETYRAQKDKWPGPLSAVDDSGAVFQRSNNLGYNNSTANDRYVLDASEVRETVMDVVKETVRNGNPLMDISGLYVSRDSGEANTHGYGMDFRDAVRGTKKSPRKMSLGEMHFGYPEQSHGWFRRFKMVYSVPTDSLEVTEQ